jgi:hypothetical protein
MAVRWQAGVISSLFQRRFYGTTKRFSYSTSPYPSNSAVRWQNERSRDHRASPAAPSPDSARGSQCQGKPKRFCRLLATSAGFEQVATK